MIPYRLISIYFLIHSYIYMCIYLFTQGQIQKFWFQGRSHYFWFQRGGGGRPTLKIRYLYLLKIAKFSGEKGVCVCVCQTLGTPLDTPLLLIQLFRLFSVHPFLSYSYLFIHLFLLI